MSPVRRLLAATLAVLAFAVALPAAASAGEWLGATPNLFGSDWPGTSGPPNYGYYRSGPLTVTDDRGVTTLVYSDFIFNGPEGWPQGVWVTRRYPGETGFHTPVLVPGSDTYAAGVSDIQVDPDGNVTIQWGEYNGPSDRPVAIRTLKPDDTWTDLQRPFGTGYFPTDVRMGVGGHGEVIFLSTRTIAVPSGNNRQVVRVARRRTLDGDFSAPRDLSATTGWKAEIPNLAMGPKGEAVVAWTETASDGSGTRRAWTRYAPAGGDFAPAVALAKPAGAASTDYFTAFWPAVDSAGRAQILYRYGSDYVAGPRYLAVRSPGAGGSFGAPVKATDYPADPQAVMSRDGDWTLLFARDEEAGPGLFAATRRVGDAGFTETRVRAAGAGFADAPRLAVGPAGDAMATWGESDIDGYVRLKSLTRPAGSAAWGNLRTFTPASHVSHIVGVNLDAEGNALAIFDQDGVLKTRGYDAHGPHFDPLPSAPPAAKDHLQFSVSDAWTGVASATWAFGDGATATGVKVDHVYAAAGTYTQTVTAKDGAGNTETLTRQITVSGATKPRLEAAPEITGRAQVDFALATDGGTWTGDPTSVSRQWQRCDSAGTGCADVAGATGAAYSPVGADVGKRLRVRATATNALGTSAPAFSDPTEVVLAAPPHNTSSPYVTGRPRTGYYLTAYSGAWDGDPTGYRFQWRRCDAQGAACTDIDGAQSANYAPVGEDIGHRLRVRVVAESARGDSQPVASAATEVITAPVPPQNTAKPAVTSDPVENAAVAADAGQWSDEPYAYEYQWQRCDAQGAACADLAGATGSTYSPVAADVGRRLRVKVRAQNDVGVSDWSTSNASARVAAAPKPPLNTVAPAISGKAQPGQTLTASHGSWTESPTSYTYSWLRCDGADACYAVGGYDATYTVATNDLGFRMRVEVTAYNAAGGSSPVRSGATAVVEEAPTAPGLVAVPTISGEPWVGQVLTGTDGAWTGNPTGYAHQWLRCDDVAENCIPIEGATGQTMLLGDADAGHAIRFRVTARNAAGDSTPAQSSSTALIVGKPVNSAAPVLTGGVASGTELYSSTGEWSGPPNGFSFSWLRCDASGEGCAPVPGVGEQVYLLNDADVGHTLRSVVVARNQAGDSAPARSAASAVIQAAPSDVGPGDTGSGGDGGSGGGGFSPTGGGGGGSSGDGDGDGPGGGPGGPTGVVDLSPAGKLKLSGKRKLELGFAAACPASAAPAGCELAITVRRGRKVIGRKTVTLAPGASSRGLAITLGKRDAKKARKGLRVAVSVIGSIAGQQTSQAQRAGRVKAKKRRR
ncbi:MAG TPA: PKD domain-containing protein [Solirubrobacteraceae bacterium]